MKRRERERLRFIGATYQRTATYLAAGAAVEAAATVGHGWSGLVIACIGIVMVAIPTTRRILVAYDEVRLARARALREAFDLRHKYGFPPGLSADAVFREQHPAHAKILEGGVSQGRGWHAALK